MSDDDAEFLAMVRQRLKVVPGGEWSGPEMARVLSILGCGPSASEPVTPAEPTPQGACGLCGGYILPDGFCSSDCEGKRFAAREASDEHPCINPTEAHASHKFAYGPACNPEAAREPRATGPAEEPCCEACKNGDHDNCTDSASTFCACPCPTEGSEVQVAAEQPTCGTCKHEVHLNGCTVPYKKDGTLTGWTCGCPQRGHDAASYAPAPTPAKGTARERAHALLEGTGLDNFGACAHGRGHTKMCDRLTKNEERHDAEFAEAEFRESQWHGRYDAVNIAARVEVTALRRDLDAAETLLERALVAMQHDGGDYKVTDAIAAWRKKRKP